MRSWASNGGTVLFATHYLEEADAFADRIVLLRGGQVVADGSTGQIRALAGGRTIRATFGASAADVPAQEILAALPGVAGVEVRSNAVPLACQDSDAGPRAPISGCASAHDIEVSGAGLEDAFLALTTSALSGTAGHDVSQQEE